MSEVPLYLSQAFGAMPRRPSRNSSPRSYLTAILLLHYKGTSLMRNSAFLDPTVGLCLGS